MKDDKATVVKGSGESSAGAPENEEALENEKEPATSGEEATDVTN